MTKKLPEELVEKLNQPLPAEALSQHPTKKYLTAIKVIYIVERLNEVFGVNGWQQRNEPMDSPGKMKQVHSFLDIPEYDIHLDNFGGNDNVDEGDAWKGAATDALSKMASYLGIGMDVYKGKATLGTTANSGKATEKQKVLIRELMEQKEISLEKMYEDGITRTTPASEVIDYLKKYKTDSRSPYSVDET